MPELEAARWLSRIAASPSPIFDLNIILTMIADIKQLGVEPQSCLYIGDGSSQELTGAERVGMQAVLLDVANYDPADNYRVDADDWNGQSVLSLKQVLTLLL
jgi:putative hydrolase of the HAD superfamily